MSTTNTTALSTSQPDDPPSLLLHCWLLSTCDSCLASPYPCSWCSVSNACVPNTLFPFPFAILSPLKSESVCPLSWRERWELRAKPFSCRCSTMTLMSVVVAVFSTLVALLLIWLFVKAVRWGVRRWRGRKEGWWRINLGSWGGSLRWRKKNEGVEVEGAGDATNGDAERQPLLDGG